MNEPGTIPLLRINGEELVKMRIRLEDLFRNLNRIHDLIIVCGEAVGGMADCGTEAASCLQQLEANKLYSQMRALTNIIERLGGKNAFTEHEAAIRAIQTKALAEAKRQEDTP